MAIAFVLINTELGQGSHVETSLKDIGEVKEVYAVYGVYDYIVKLETESMSELKEIIASKIRRIEHVRSTLTMISVE
ncbi:Lrp/AsnC family transcriptional regulator [Thermoproteota archaeon]